MSGYEEQASENIAGGGAVRRYDLTAGIKGVTHNAKRVVARQAKLLASFV